MTPPRDSSGGRERTSEDGKVEGNRRSLTRDMDTTKHFTASSLLIDSGDANGSFCAIKFYRAPTRGYMTPNREA